VIVASAFLALLSSATPGEPPAGPVDPRSEEVLREECLSTIDRREVTLFGNGTIRLRQGPKGREAMRLAEIARDEVDALREILRGLDLSETDRVEIGVEGAWVERCTILLPANDAKTRKFAYGRYGSHSLALSRAIAIANDLAERAAGRPDRPSAIPKEYQPKQGDRLERRDGELFEVVGPTVDLKGVELVGVRIPLTLYLRIEDLDVEFLRVVPRGEGP